MDQLKPTEQSKPTKPKGKKLLTILLVLLLLAAAAGTGYYLARSNKKDATNNTSEETPAEVDEETEILKARFETTKKDLAKSGDQPAAARAALYASAAFDGARIDAPEAKGYALEALKLYPADSVKNPPAEFKGFITTLTEISKGNYDSAKGKVNTNAEPLPQ